MGVCCSKKRERGRSARWVAGRDLPPPPPEEETVKEVLSETPKTRPKPPALPPPPKLEPDFKFVPQPKEISRPGFTDERSDEPPQPSDEACSVTDSLPSVSNIPTDHKEDAAVVSPPPKIRQTSKRFHSGELTAGAGGRKERSSPAVVVSGAGCRSGRTSPSPSPAGRSRSLSGNGVGNGIRRDPGERSGRRSVSPAAKRVADHQRRVPPPPPKLKGNDRVPSRRIPLAPPQTAAPATGDGGPAGVGQEGKESLENPSVSLECFIFL